MPVRLYSMSCRYDNRPARESSLVCVVAIELIKPVIITNAFIYFIASLFYSFPNEKVLSGKYAFTSEIPYSTHRAGRRSWGTIVLSRERTERSRTIPSFRKKKIWLSYTCATTKLQELRVHKVVPIMSRELDLLLLSTFHCPGC